MPKKTSLKGSEILVYFFNILISIGLIASYITPYISPLKIPKFSLLSLLFPLFFGANLIFLIYWLLKRKKQIILSIIALLLGYNHMSSLYKLDGKEILQSKDIKIMSYNVKTFDYYKWSNEDSLAHKIIDFVHKKDPNILLLQEFYNHQSVNFKLPYKFVKMKSKTNKFGLAIYSKYPIVNSGSLNFKNSANNIIFCDMIIKKDTVRVYNVHLESLRVDPEKENFGQETSEKLIARLSSGFKKQAQQTESFLMHQKQWNGKSIVAGDFNNTAFSWVYKNIKGNKKDAFIESGKGFGKTYDYFFPLRIDFIFADESFKVNNFKTFHISYSDHFPILASLDLDSYKN